MKYRKFKEVAKMDPKEEDKTLMAVIGGFFSRLMRLFVAGMLTGCYFYLAILEFKPLIKGTDWYLSPFYAGMGFVCLAITISSLFPDKKMDIPSRRC